MPADRDFRLLAAGQALSWFGTGFQTVALSVAVVRSGGGAGALGAVLAASILATLVGTLFGGVWADRLQPQSIMIAADLVRFATAGGMAALYGAGGRSVPLLCILAAAGSGAGSFFTPAMTSLKPTLVPPARRQSANASLSLLQTVCSVAGPAAGGLLVAVLGASAGFTVNALSFLASVGTLLFIRVEAPRAARTGLRHELGAGWQEMSRHDWLRAGVFAATAYHVANGAVLVLTQLVAIRELGGASSVGLLSAAEGVGGVLGAAAAMRARPVRPLRAGWFTLQLMPLWVLTYVWPSTLSAVVAGAVVGYAGLGFFSVMWETAIQDRVPHHLLARVASWDMVTSFAALPVGSALAGPLAETLGLHATFIGCAAVMALAGAAPLLVRGSRTLTRPVTVSPSPTTSR